MVRARNGFAGKAERFVPAGACICALVLAWTMGLARGASAEEKPAAETARLEKTGSEIQSAPSEGDLFRHEPFDASQLRMAKTGALVIRVGEIFRDPRFNPYVPVVNALAQVAGPGFLKMPVDGFDVSQIEWIACNLHVVTVSPQGGKHPTLAVGVQSVVIRLNRPADLQQAILASVPKSSLQTYHGQNYVQMPAIPELDPGESVLRFPDDKTIVALFGVKPDDDEVKEKFLKRLFDDKPNEYAWADAWRTADGGLITLAFDNRNLSWRELDGMEGVPEAAWPALTKTEFVAASFDWNHQTERVAIRMKSACADRPAAEQVAEATQELLSLLTDLNSHLPDDEGADRPDGWLLQALQPRKFAWATKRPNRRSSKPRPSSRCRSPGCRHSPTRPTERDKRLERPEGPWQDERSARRSSARRRTRHITQLAFESIRCAQSNASRRGNSPSCLGRLPADCCWRSGWFMARRSASDFSTTTINTSSPNALPFGPG